MAPDLNTLHAIETLLAHRTSIRRFRADVRIDQGLVERCVQLACRAPSAFEAYSVVQVSAPEVRSRLPYDRPDAPVCLILCLDFRRLAAILGVEAPKGLPLDSWLLFWGLADAFIFGGTLILLLEAAGLGTVILGGVARRPGPYLELLALPTGVLPLMGIAAGVPAESPPIRPRLGAGVVLHHDRYYDRPLDAAVAERQEYADRTCYFKKYGTLDESGETVVRGWGDRPPDVVSHLARKVMGIRASGDLASFQATLQGQLGIWFRGDSDDE